MFLEDGLCSLHRERGEQALPGSYATLPRRITHVPGGCESSGDLACPEAARLYLLTPDATDPVEIRWEHLPPNALVTREVPPEATDFEAVRARA